MRGAWAPPPFWRQWGWEMGELRRVPKGHPLRLRPTPLPWLRFCRVLGGGAEVTAD